MGAGGERPRPAAHPAVRQERGREDSVRLGLGQEGQEAEAAAAGGGEKVLGQEAGQVGGGEGGGRRRRRRRRGGVGGQPVRLVGH